MHHSSRAKSATFMAGLMGIGALCSIHLVGCAGGSDVDKNSSSSSNTGGSGAAGGAGGGADGGAGNAGNEGIGGTGQGGVGTGGVGNAGGTNCGETSSTATSELLPADIIIAVDTSTSMTDGFFLGLGSEVNQVNQNLASAAALIAGSNIDAHVIMIADGEICIPSPLGSGSCPADENLAGGYMHVDHFLDSSLLYQGVLDKFPDYQSFLRPNATKRILFVTDDDDNMAPAGNASAFIEQLTVLDPTFADVKIDAIVAFLGPLDACSGGCGSDPCCPCDPIFTTLPVPLSAAAGDNYRLGLGLNQGVEGNLCLQAFGPFFVEIGNAVVNDTPISCDYLIPDPPANETLDPKKVNVEFVPGSGAPQDFVNVANVGDCVTNGWYYDNPVDPQTIHICPSACTAIQADADGEINVKFGCETQVVAN